MRLHASLLPDNNGPSGPSQSGSPLSPLFDAPPFQRRRLKKAPRADSESTTGWIRPRLAKGGLYQRADRRIRSQS